MPKPTFLQTLLNQPSQSYTNAQKPSRSGRKSEFYHSVRNDMARAAASAESSRAQTQTETGTNVSPAPVLPPLPAAQSTTQLSQHNQQVNTDLYQGFTEEKDTEAFFTPSASPRHSVIEQGQDKHFLKTTLPELFMGEQPTLRSLMENDPSATAQAKLQEQDSVSSGDMVDDAVSGPHPEPTKVDSRDPQPTPEPLRREFASSSPSVASSNTPDGTTSEGSWPSSFSAPSTSTRATTPATSDSGHACNSSTSRNSTVRRKKSDNGRSTTMTATTYTDDDWAKDVRWLVSPTSQIPPDKRKSWRSGSKGSSTAASPVGVGTVAKRSRAKPLFELGPMTLIPTLPNVPLPLQMRAANRRTVSQSTVGSRRTMGRRRMSAVWEEDEGDETAPNSPRRVHTDPVSLSSLARARSLSSPQKAPSERGRSPTRAISRDSGSTASSEAPSSAFTSTSRTVDLPNPLPVTDGGTPTGFTSLVLPRAAHTYASPKRYSLLFGSSNQVDITRMGLAQTTMSSISITKNAAASALSGARPRLFSLSSLSLLAPGPHAKSHLPETPSHLLGTLPLPLGFTSHTPPPSKVNSHQVLVQVHAVAVDGLDDRIVSERVARKDSYGFVPGRSFVGRAVEVGFEVNNAAKGDWVIGLLDVRKCGALAEFLVVEKRHVARCPRPSPSLTLEQLALLPLCGVPAHRAMRTAGIDADSEPESAHGRALVLNGHDGAGALAVQALSHAGMHVTAHIPLHADSRRSRTPSTSSASTSSSEPSDETEDDINIRVEQTSTRGAEDRVRRWGARGVRIGDAVEVIENCDPGSFDLVIDTVGGKQIWEACQHVVAASGQFTTLVGDVASSPTPSPPISVKSSPSTTTRSLSPFHFNHHSKSQPNPHNDGKAGRAVPSINQHFRANLRSLSRTFKARKAIGYALISPASDVDQFGEDVRDSLLEAVRRASAGIFVPFVDEDDEKGKRVASTRVVPFERTPELFCNGLLNDGRTGIVKVVD